MKFLSRVFRFIPQFSGIVFLHYGFIVLFRLWGLLAMGGSGNATDILNGIVADIVVINVFLLLLYIPYGLIALKNSRIASIIAGGISILFYVLSAPVQVYFIYERQLLNISYYNCSVCKAYFASFNEISLAGWFLPMLVLLLAGVGFLWWLIRKNIVFPAWVGKIVLVLLIGSVPLAAELKISTGFLNKNGYRISKPYHFAQSGVVCFSDKITGKADRLSGAALYQSLRAEDSYVSTDEYPLLRTFEQKECLSGYFAMEDLAGKPHIVMIIVEGLGDLLMNPVKGVTFMPFLQELAQKGIYWDHFLATSERDQNTLPSMMGGLPYGDNGFTQKPIVPYHFSLLNILKHNNYNTAYFTGQWNWFLTTDKFLSFNNTDVIVDAADFPQEYNRILFGEDGYFWGYNDRDLLHYYSSARLKKLEQPRFDIIQTGSMKSPFFFDNKDHYNNLFRDFISSAENPEDRRYLESKKESLTSAIYTDDMLRLFFEEYAKTTEYNNTIFVVTGNYPMPEIGETEGLKKYHVPLIIYNSALSHPERIHTLSSHSDFSTSLLSFLGANYTMNIPHFTTSTGKNLCQPTENDKTFIPLLNRNGEIREMVLGNYYTDADQQIHEIGEGLNLQPVTQRRKELRARDVMEAFEQVNATSSVNLMPDSLFFGFFNYKILADTITSGRRVRDEYRNIIEDLSIQQGIHYIDIRLHKPEVSLEEVFVVFELHDESGNLLEWQNHGVPGGDENFSVRIELDNQYTLEENTYLKVFLWNQSPVAYSFEKARVVVYTPENHNSHPHTTD